MIIIKCLCGINRQDCTYHAVKYAKVEIFLYKKSDDFEHNVQNHLSEAELKFELQVKKYQFDDGYLCEFVGTDSKINYWLENSTLIPTNEIDLFKKTVVTFY